MTAPLYLLDHPLDGVDAGDDLVLTGDEARHAVTVRRTRPGERVDVADGLGGLARCTVSEATRQRLVLAVQAVETVPVARPALILVQALAKGGRDELAVETATELGVDQVLPWQARRSVVVWSGERGRRALDKWRGVVRSAGKQSRRARLPHVGEPMTTAGLLEWAADLTGAGSGAVLVLHEDGEAPLTQWPVPEGVDRVAIVVGPEGGITEDELAGLSGAGADVVRLGPTVLRSSTAGPAALSLLSAALGRWT